MCARKAAYTPLPVPSEPQPASLSVAEIKQLGDIFQGLLKDTHLKGWIIAAGIGAAVEAVHVGWLALLWVFGRLPR